MRRAEREKGEYQSSRLSDIFIPITNARNDRHRISIRRLKPTVLDLLYVPKQRIDCNFGMMIWNNQRETYSCSVREKVILENAEIEFIGDEMSGKTRQNVEAILFDDCNISKIPQGLTKTFPNLKILHIKYSRLKTIETVDLKEYGKLTHLYLDLNLIEFLPQGLFSNIRNLIELSISDNNLQIIEPDAFNGLQYLKVFNLASNPCIDKWFDLYKNSGYTNLQQITAEIQTKFAGKSWNIAIEKINNEIKLQKEVQSFKLKNCGLTSELLNVIKNNNLRDFKVTIGDEEFKVHKMLLAARSQVFAEMFEKNIDAECLNLVDISPAIFREVLSFIYTDEFPKSADINFMHLFGATAKLKIEHLKNFAVDKLIDSLNHDNALEILILSNKYDCKSLRDRAFCELKRMLGDMKLDENLALETDKLKKLIDIKKRQDELMRAMEVEFQTTLNEN